MAAKVGFIGLGDMGFPMARRLLNHGFEVHSSAHRRRDAIEALKAEGLAEHCTPREVAGEVDVLITLVVDDKQTDAVLHGESGALAGMSRGSVLIIMSTVAPTFCIDIAQLASEQGVTVLDCPVSGGPTGAEKGTLALILGGETEAMERCRAVLEVMGRIFHCGDVGMGQIAKLANNAVGLATVTAIGEACSMARAYGMDADRLMEILNSSTGQSFITNNWGYVVAEWLHLRELGKKDVGLCIEAARAKEKALPLIEMCYRQDWTINPSKY